MLNARKSEVTEALKETAAPEVMKSEETPVIVKENESRKRKLETDDNSNIIDVDISNDSEDEIMVVEEIKGVSCEPKTKNVRPSFKTDFRFLFNC
jgi:hypothetical protein